MKDEDIKRLIAAEEKRQREGLELIPSENVCISRYFNSHGQCFY